MVRDVPVDDDRRITAGARRENIIRSLSRELDPKEPTSAARRLQDLIVNGPARPLIVSGDIDGLVSAAMVRKAAPAWDAVALIVKSGTVYLHPDAISSGLPLADCFGVDVFSTYVPNVSNHVALWGSKRPGGSAEALAAANAYDAEVKARNQSTLLATPSLWAGIEGSYGEAGSRPRAAGYRYPLGTAQILLAMLEVIDRSPKMFDRDYLPWLVANCDGGLKTIRDYAHTVPMWWSCLAAAVGPASISEQIYRVAATQRPTEFVDTVNRLRAESQQTPDGPANHLDDNWNLRSQTLADVGPVVRWISSISGWPDPFRGGVEHLDDWVPVPLLTHGKLLTTGLPKGKSQTEQVEKFKANLRASLEAVHTNFAFFDQSQRLNWVAAWPGATLPDLGSLPAALEPSVGLFETDEDVAESASSQIVL